MKVSVITQGTENVASARIRAYTLQKSLAALGHETRLSPWQGADVVVVQKSVDFATLQFARKARRQGKVVFYDVDDLGDALWAFVSERNFYEMTRIASAVTTDTAGHRLDLMSRYQVPRVEIVPDAVDYLPDALGPMVLREDARLRVLWFGCSSNLELFERYAVTLRRVAGIQVVVVSDAKARARLAPAHPEIEFNFWSRSSFVNTLRGCDLAFLTHDGSDLDRAKSNNKMITSVAWGVPAVVSDTPEYLRTAQEAGVEECVFHDPSSVAEVIERLKSVEARRDYLARAQSVIWRRYSPLSVAAQFVDVCAQVTAETSAVGHVEIGEEAGAATAESSVVGGPAGRFVRKLAFERWRLRRGEPLAAVASGLIRDGLKAVRRPPHRRVTIATSVVGGEVESGHNEAAGVFERDYIRDWVSPEGSSYRMRTYERQREGGSQPLLSNPGVDEVKEAIRCHGARTVLEVGCGWGRLLAHLGDEFKAEGCDVSVDMLALCAPGLRVFEFNVADENRPFIRENAGRWDLLFTRGVMCYFMEHPLQMANAVNNMLALAKKAIVIWEWPEVCLRIREFTDSRKFDYRPIDHRAE